MTEKGQSGLFTRYCVHNDFLKVDGLTTASPTNRFILTLCSG